MTGCYENIPLELTELQQWVAYRTEPKPNGKLDKIPVNPKTGELAKTDKPETWAGFNEALTAVKKYKLAGIGFVFTSRDPYCGIDLDDCRDPKTGSITPEAKKWIAHFKSYTEITPSGKGFHIIIKGKLPPRGRKKGKLETYDEKRFFTFTGDVFDDSH